MAQFVSSLRCRLIALVLLAVIPAFGVILHSGARHRELTADQIQRNTLGAARAIAAEQERFLENAHQLLVTLARVPQVREMDKTACSKVLAGLLEPLYADLSVVDLKGNVICSALPPGSSLARSNGSYLKRVIDTHDFSVGGFRTLPSTGETVLDLGYPVSDSPGQLRAVIYLALDLSWITRITADSHLDPGASFTLVENNGTVLLRYPHQEKWLGKSIFATSRDKDVISQDADGTIESVGADYVPRLFAFNRLKTPTGGPSIYAAIDIPTASAFAEADRILAHNLITFGLLSALTLIAAWFGADLFVLRRIRDLVFATKQVAAGNLNARTHLPYGKSELGQLAQTFDELAGHLEKREAEAKGSFVQIHRQRQRQIALHDINLAITSTLDLTQVLSSLLDATTALFPSFAATVSWINRQTGALECIAHRNLGGGEAARADTEIEHGLPNVVLKSQSPLVVANAQTDPRATSLEFFRRHRLFSYLGVPMIAKGEALGVLSFYTKHDREFGPEETDFLIALGNQAAIAIYNSRLFEQIKEQAVELARSNKIKDEFLGVMSHELRTPLNIITNYAEALRMGTFGDMTTDQRGGMDKIKSQAGQLLALINGILEITKIESGSVTLVKESVDLGQFVAELRSDYRMPGEKNLILKWEHPAALPVIVSDQTKLTQILTNLINNAIKFTERGSVVIAIRTWEQGDQVEFTVSDTGPGIPKELIPAVFDKFRQLDSTTTRTHSGAGLGLYIVKTFVELLDGTISVESVMGQGSKFTVRLPTGPIQGKTRTKNGTPVASPGLVS